jgi:coenzyme F420-reducing hydrogenase delta subunit
MGIEKERIRIELSVDPEGIRIQQLVKEMSEDLAKLGPPKRSAAVRKTSKKEAVKAGGRK